MNENAHVKGIGFINRCEYITTKFGEAGVDKVAARLSPDAAKTLRASSASSWYPFQHVIDVDKAIVDTFFEGDLLKARDIGQYNLERNVKTVYRILFQVLQPSFVVRKASALFSKMVDQGTLEAREIASNEVELRLVGLNPGHDVYCRILEGSFLGTLKACGIKDASIDHPECAVHGGQASVFRVKW